MSMKKIFENYRKGKLVKEQEWYNSPEETSDGADYQRAQIEPDGTELGKGAVRKGVKAFISFRPNGDDYKIEGDTHGMFSHMTKHMWEFPKLQVGMVATIKSFQKSFKSSVPMTLKKKGGNGE